MRTLIVLTLFVYFGCTLVSPNSHMDEDIDPENSMEVEDDKDHDYDDHNDIVQPKENGYIVEEVEDEIDDTSDAVSSLEVTTPYNFLRYAPQAEHIEKYPRFAILRGNWEMADDFL